MRAGVAAFHPLRITQRSFAAASVRAAGAAPARGIRRVDSLCLCIHSSAREMEKIREVQGNA
jgi:hypothetical protein